MSDNWPVKWCDTTILQHKFCTMDHKDMMEDPVRMYKGDVWLIISSTSFIQSLTRMHGAEFARLVHARDWMFFFLPTENMVISEVAKSMVFMPNLATFY